MDDDMADQRPNRIARNGTQSNRRSRRMIAFGWYGGKFSHLDFLLPNLPNDARHFCDVFGGSAAVLINREPAPVETYNDLDSELVNFFSTLRHPDMGEQLLKEIELTPFSREELALACTRETELGPIERARRFYVRARQTRTGLAQTSSVGRWAHCISTSRSGMAGAVSRWLGSIDGLSPIVDRLLRVQIDNAPAIEVIQRYDTPDTLFYLDPPYVHDARGDKHAYYGEMSDVEHIELAGFLHGIKGRAAISGYRSDLYDSIYADWNRVDAPEKNCHSVRQPRRESLWMNYEPICRGQGRLGETAPPRCKVKPDSISGLGR